MANKNKISPTPNTKLSKIFLKKKEKQNKEGSAYYFVCLINCNHFLYIIIPMDQRRKM